MSKDTIEMRVLSVPKEVAREINNMTVNSLKAIVEHAKTLDEKGELYAFSNAVDISTKAWLLTQIENGMNPREAIECFVTLLTEQLLPSFIDIPDISNWLKKDIVENAADYGVGLAEQVSNSINKNDGEAFAVKGGTLDDIIEQLSAIRDAREATKQ